MDWRGYGACKGSEVDFFPEPKAGRLGSLPARRICEACFVRGQCLDHALKYNELGIWGGTNEAERKYIKARYLRDKARKALDANTFVR
jgi:hypothetical protein